MLKTIHAVMLSVLLALFLSLSGVATSADDEPRLSGDFKGEITLPTGPLKMIFSFDIDNKGSLTSTLSIPAQGLKDLKADSTKLAGTDLTVKINQFGIIYTATYDAETGGLNGTFQQGLATFELNLDAPIAATIFNGSYAATLENPIKNTLTVMGDEATDSLYVTWPLEGYFSEKVDLTEKSETQLSGSNGGSLSIAIRRAEPFVLNIKANDKDITTDLDRKNDDIKPADRPQSNTKLEDYGFQQIPLAFSRETLPAIEGILTLPDGTGPFPVAVLINGSGPQDFDSTLFDHRPFRVIAKALAEIGIASFRYNDRNWTADIFEFGKATSADFATDASFALAQLKERSDIDGENTVYIGHSEGGLIAPLAQQKEAASALVLLGAPGVPLDSLLLEQITAIAIATGSPKAVAAGQRTFFDGLFNKARGVMDPAERRKVIEAYAATSGLPPALQEQLASQYETRWWAFQGVHDPIPPLKAISVPVIAIFGGSDLQVLANQNRPPLEAALAESGTKDVTVVTLQKLNHLFQTDPIGSPADYAKNTETMSPNFLKRLQNWLGERLVSPAP